MKRILIAILSIIAVLCASSCATEYYEPVFGEDNLPTIIPSGGGIYTLKYRYQYYDTKTSLGQESFEWECRTIIDGQISNSVVYRDAPGAISTYMVTVPSNFDSYPKAITVEASTHVYTSTEDWWGDWTPIASSVQLAR